MLQAPLLETYGDNGVVDLEVDANATKGSESKADETMLKSSAHLYSTPSLMVTGFFFKAASSS